VTPEITSPANPLIKRIKKLRLRKERDAEGAFFVEGIRPVWSAVAAQAPIETLLVAPDLLTSIDARALVDDFRAAGGPVVEVSADAFAAAADREHPSGLGAVVRSRYVPLGNIKLGPTGVAAVLEDVANPGNLGTILRTADAAAVDAVVLVGEGTDPFHPTAVKASMGALFTVPVARAFSIDEVIDWAHEQGCSIVATSARAADELWDADVGLPAVVLFGSEAEGLAPDVLERADVALRIPMHGDASSLNLAVAAGIVLYELTHKKQRPNGGL
jgi:RNA methyltransferase, TrmH family